MGCLRCCWQMGHGLAIILLALFGFLQLKIEYHLKMPLIKTILLAMHLIMINLASIGPLFCIGLVCKTSSEARQSARWLAGKCCLALFIGMLLGGTIIKVFEDFTAALDAIGDPQLRGLVVRVLGVPFRGAVRFHPT